MNKRVAGSRTEQVQILTLGSLNGYNRLFGGQLMEWIDIVAAVVAVSLPLIVLFLIFRRKIMDGVSRGGTKG